MINYGATVGYDVIKALPRPADDGSKSLNRGILSAAGKAAICFQEEVTSFTSDCWGDEATAKRVAAAAAASVRAVQAADLQSAGRRAKKWFGIRWRQRGADASESNSNLVFQRNVLIFFLLCSGSAGCCPVTGVAVWTCRQFIAGPHTSH